MRIEEGLQIVAIVATTAFIVATMTQDWQSRLGVVATTMFSAPVQHSLNYDFHSRDYDLRLAVKTRCSRDNGHDYDTLFSTLVLRSREYIMGS